MISETPLIFKDFEIRAWRSASNQIQVLVHSSPAGDMRQPQPVTVGEPELKKLAQLSLAGGSLTDAARLGAQLARILLPQLVSDLLNASLRQLSPAEGLRLRLCLDEALADLPWEFLLRPDTPEQNQLKQFLALDPRISLVREAPRTVRPSPPAVDKQQLLFFAMANADPTLKLEEEYADLVAALTPVSSYLQITQPSSRSADMRATLRQPVTIFHYTGWTVLPKEGGSYLAGSAGTTQGVTAAWSDPAFQSGWVSCEEIGQLLQSAGARLVLLSACYSARWAVIMPFINHGIPAAIGISGAVLGEECIAFFTKFYMSLAVGLSLDEAVMWARLHLLEPGVLRSHDTDAWGQFVVYMPTDDPVLLPQLPSSQNLSDQQAIFQKRQNTFAVANYAKQKLFIPEEVKSVELKVLITAQGDLVVDSVPMGTLNTTRLAALQDDIASIREECVASDAGIFKRVGSGLFNALFNDDLRSIYEKRLQWAKKNKRILRINLRFDASESLTWPWEYLYDAKNDLFLGSNDRIALCRQLARCEAPAPLTLDERLRVLAVISNPKDLSTSLGLKPLSPDLERENLTAALSVPGLPPNDQPIDLRFLVDPPSGRNLKAELDDFKPHIWHFVGHGVKRDDGFQLVMAKDDGHSKYKNADEIAELLRDRADLRVVVLAACNSGAPAVGQAMTTLAPRLLQSRIPAVLVMQHPVFDTTVRRFALQFYNALRDGKPVDFAVNLARWTLREAHPDWRDFGTPILYAQKTDLFRPPEVISAPPDNPRALRLL